MKLTKISLIIIGFAAVAAVAVLGTVSSRLTQPKNANSQSRENISESPKTWDVAFTASFGKNAPDFSVEDIEGKTHKLSDYQGRNVVVVFWATWCPACNLEIPHLIELRKTVAEDKLAILSISNEEPEHLKNFATLKGINYTIASLGDSPLPEPFADVTSIPTTFFIDPEGKIKFAAVGLVSLADARVIMNVGL
ncbi:MAG: peroxiredoxin family protein [Planctomycetota bacterium]|jgi:peroxiredoxin